MNPGRCFGLFLTLALVLSGCAGLAPVSPSPQPAAASPTPETAGTLLPAIQTPAPASTVPEPAVTALTVWVPPEFDPQSGSQAGNLLRQRLQEYSDQEGGLEITVRVKALTGQASLLESLSAARPAAPAALPDLIALNRANLETAALKGLIYPYEGLSQEIDDPDWFEYSRQLGILQGSNFGLPFAGDALALLYRPARMPDPAADWDALLRLTGPMVFAAADPQAVLTLALYQGAGGAIQDAQGRPALDAEILAKVLKIYQQGSSQGLFPQWIGTIENQDQAWQAYREERAHLAAAWISDYLGDNPPDTAVQPLPAAGDTSVTLARGWSWALGSPDEERRAAAARLAEFLVDGDFLADWSEASGCLPTRPTSLAAWNNQGQQALLSQVILSAQSVPADDLLLALGQVLKDAVLQVLLSGADPLKAAEAAAQQFTTP